MEATAATLERRVRVIPATRKPEELHRDHDGKMRVAAYCRVSTDSEEQLNSYEAQKTYYTQKIQDSPDWEMAGSMPMRVSPGWKPGIGMDGYPQLVTDEEFLAVRLRRGEQNT